MDSKNSSTRLMNGVDSTTKINSTGEGSAALKAREMMIKLGLDVDEIEGDINSSERSDSDWSAMSSPVKGLSRSNSGEAINGRAIERNLPPSASTTRNLATPSSSPSGSRSPTLSNYSYSTPSSPLPTSPINSNSSSTKSNTYNILSRLSSGNPSQLSKFSEVHTRHVSLTSACLPVTSSDMSPTNSRHGLNIVSGFFGGSTSCPSPTTATGTGSSTKSWNISGWNSSGLKVPGSPTSSNAPRKLSKSLSPISSSSISSPNSFIDTILSFPSIILHKILSPLSNNNSSTTNKSSKKASLPIRLIFILYLIFSVLFFGVKVLNWSTGTSTTSNTRGVIEKVINRLGSRSDDVLILKTKGGREVGNDNRLVSELAGSSEVTSSVSDSVIEDSEWAIVKRIGEADDITSKFKLPYRFSKMHDTTRLGQNYEIIPFAFKSSSTPSPEDVTACLYSNTAWLLNLAPFVHAWKGPISLVFEVPHSRYSPLRSQLLESISSLRQNDPLIEQFVDFHIVGTPTSTTEGALRKIRERLIEHPTAFNFHSNLARFFAKTEIVFLVGDARIIPSQGLRKRLVEPSMRKVVLERGDAIVVPTFGFLRGSAATFIPTLNDIRYSLGLALNTGIWDGVEAEEFDALAEERIKLLYDSLPLSTHSWPAKKSALVNHVNIRPSSSSLDHDSESIPSSTLALFDKDWDLNHGPTNWYLWRKFSTDSRLSETKDLGGGLDLGLDGGVGGGKELFKVMDYDLHYAPNVVISQRGQPWCTERFENLKAACVYQMYLSGAELWVLPDEWTYTVEVIESSGNDGSRKDPVEKLRNSITTRLYGKFHQEACMHYGREFLSVQMWDSDKAQHLRSTCAKTLYTWGMGS